MRQVRHLHEGVSASIRRSHQVVAPFPRPYVSDGIKKYFTPPTHPARAGLVRGAEVTEGRIFLSGGETDDRIEILSPLRGSLIERPGARDGSRIVIPPYRSRYLRSILDQHDSLCALGAFAVKHFPEGMNTFASLTIDGKRIRAPEGHTILWAALGNGIYIPNLCAIREQNDPLAACRLCFVEIDGQEEPVTACTEPVREGMIIRTKGKTALRLARTSAELLLANHPLDCGHCTKNRLCELQTIAKHLGIKLKTKRFRKLERNLPIDESSPVFIFDPNKCVLCGKCVWVCRERLGIGAIGFTRRGYKRIVSTFGDRPLIESRCVHCGECVKVCPVGALVEKRERSQR